MEAAKLSTEPDTDGMAKRIARNTHARLKRLTRHEKREYAAALGMSSRGVLQDVATTLSIRAVLTTMTCAIYVL